MTAHLRRSGILIRVLLVLTWLVAGPLVAGAQAPSWQMLTPLTGADGPFLDVNQAQAVATDASGNVYLAGTLSGTAAFGADTLVSVGSYDIFVAKWSPVSRTFVWAQQAGGIGMDSPNGIAVSGNNVYVVGSFGQAWSTGNSSTAATFGTTILNNPNPISSSDAFVAKITDSGSSAAWTWAMRAGGTEADGASKVAVSGNSLYVAGSFASAPASFGAITLNSSGSDDAFVAKLTDNASTGSFVWTQQVGGLGSDYATTIALNGTNLYIAGGFRSQAVSFGSTTLTNATTQALYGSDIFVAKLVDAGSSSSFVWAQKAGGSGLQDYATSLALNGSSVYVGGTFNSQPAAFGASSLQPTSNYRNVFVSKLTDGGSTGNFVWAQGVGAYDDDCQLYALAARGSSVYATGSFSGQNTSFGPFNLSVVIPQLASRGAHDIFVSRLDDKGSTGTFAWAERAGGDGRDDAYCLALSGPDIYLGGMSHSNYFTPAAFGSFTIPGPTSGTNIGYFASLRDNVPLAVQAPTAAAGLHLYPNPARSSVTLAGPAVAGTGPIFLTLYDALGRVARTVEIKAPLARPQYELNLVGLQTGAYLLRVQTGTTTAMQRLQVE